MTIKTLLITASLVLLARRSWRAGARASIPPTCSSRSPSRGRPTTATTPARRYSALTQINQTTVKKLTLAWVAQLDDGTGEAGGFGGGGAAVAAQA